MSMDVSIFKPKIVAILKASDLETVSAKKVRKQLTEQLGLDFSAHKVELKHSKREENEFGR